MFRDHGKLPHEKGADRDAPTREEKEEAADLRRSEHRLGTAASETRYEYADGFGFGLDDVRECGRICVNSCIPGCTVYRVTHARVKREQ